MSISSFYNLTPDQVLESVETLGVHATGEFYQLNSYENRVFEVRIEKENIFNTDKLIAKFYRPNRWSLDSLKEEHEFLLDLKNAGVEVVAPLVLKNGLTIGENNEIFFSVFPKFLGKMPDELLPGDFAKIGRTLGLIHNEGAQKKAHHRPIMTAENYGYRSLEILDNWIALEVKSRYLDAAHEILSYLEEYLDEKDFFRIHGDCHRGNLLKSRNVDGVDRLFFVDFDDFCNGHPAQDLWMLFQGDETPDNLDEFLDGYAEVRNYDESWVDLFEPLRGLRIIHYAKWIAQRWEDPSFPKLFPGFRDYNYWAQEVEQLERIARKL